MMELVSPNFICNSNILNTEEHISNSNNNIRILYHEDIENNIFDLYPLFIYYYPQRGISVDYLKKCLCVILSTNLNIDFDVILEIVEKKCEILNENILVFNEIKLVISDIYNINNNLYGKNLVRQFRENGKYIYKFPIYNFTFSIKKLRFDSKPLKRKRTGDDSVNTNKSKRRLLLFNTSLPPSYISPNYIKPKNIVTSIDKNDKILKMKENYEKIQKCENQVKHYNNKIDDILFKKLRVNKDLGLIEGYEFEIDRKEKLYVKDKQTEHLLDNMPLYYSLTNGNKGIKLNDVIIDSESKYVNSTEIRKLICSNDIIIVSGRPGSGKTYNITKALSLLSKRKINDNVLEWEKSTIESGCAKSLLGFSVRITFANSFCNSVSDGGIYIENYKKVNVKKICTSKNVCISLCSLLKLKKNIKGNIWKSPEHEYILYIDELNEIFDDISNIFISDFRITIFRYLKELIQKATKIIVSGDDVSAEDVLNLINIRKESEKNENDKVAYYEIKKHKKWKYTLLNEYSDWLNIMLKKLKENKRISVPCSIKKEAHELKRIISNTNPEKNVLIIDADYMNKFSDFAEQIVREKIDVFIYTGVLGTGVSIDFDNNIYRFGYFDVVFQYCTDMQPCRLQKQSIGRVRKIKENAVYIYCKDNNRNKFKYPTEISEIRKYYYSNMWRIQKMVGESGGSMGLNNMVFDDAKKELFHPEKNFDNIIFNTISKRSKDRNDFKNRYYLHLKSIGFEYFDCSNEIFEVGRKMVMKTVETSTEREMKKIFDNMKYTLTISKSKINDYDEFMTLKRLYESGNISKDDHLKYIAGKIALDLGYYVKEDDTDNGKIIPKIENVPIPVLHDNINMTGFTNRSRSKIVELLEENEMDSLSYDESQQFTKMIESKFRKKNRNMILFGILSKIFNGLGFNHFEGSEINYKFFRNVESTFAFLSSLKIVYFDAMKVSQKLYECIVTDFSAIMYNTETNPDEKSIMGTSKNSPRLSNMFFKENGITVYNFNNTPRKFRILLVFGMLRIILRKLYGIELIFDNNENSEEERSVQIKIENVKISKALEFNIYDDVEKCMNELKEKGDICDSDEFDKTIVVRKIGFDFSKVEESLKYMYLKYTNYGNMNMINKIKTISEVVSLDLVDEEIETVNESTNFEASTQPIIVNEEGNMEINQCFNGSRKAKKQLKKLISLKKRCTKKNISIIKQMGFDVDTKQFNINVDFNISTECNTYKPTDKSKCYSFRKDRKKYDCKISAFGKIFRNCSISTEIEAKKWVCYMKNKLKGKSETEINVLYNENRY